MVAGLQALCRNSGSDAAVINKWLLTSAILAGLTACSAQNSADNTIPVSGFNLDEAEIRDIANEFAIQKGMTLLCEGYEKDYLTPFMEDLRYAKAPREFRDSITEDSVEMMNKISVEETEYICTPEMFESAEARVTAAQLKWDEMRGITQ